MDSKDGSICAKAGSLCGNSAFSGKALWQSSVYDFESVEDINNIARYVYGRYGSPNSDELAKAVALLEGAQQAVPNARYVYGRYGSPNSDELAKAVALLEGAQQGLATSSGMGALVAAILSICKAGDHILAQFDCYGGSREFLENDAPRFGIKTEFVDVRNAQTLELALKNFVMQRGNNNNNNSAIVFLESISIPCIRVADLQSISTVCKTYGAFLIVDNTFPTPVRIKPLKQGADMVIHSVTKFLGGHSDLVAGVVVGSSRHVESASKLPRRWGLTAAPFDSWLATKGITTLQVRMERALSTTAVLAKRIIYGPIPVKLYWTPDCAVMSIEVGGGLDGASRAISSFKMIKFVPSLGGTTTTVSHPLSTSESSLTTDEMGAMGLTNGLLRISVGLEDVEDIWVDIERGLFAAAATD